MRAYNALARLSINKRYTKFLWREAYCIYKIAQTSILEILPKDQMRSFFAQKYDKSAECPSKWSVFIRFSSAVWREISSSLWRACFKVKLQLSTMFLV